MINKLIVATLSLILSFSASASTFDLFHPIKSAKKAAIIGVVGYVAVKTTTEYLLNNPHKLSEYLATHPDQIESINKYVDNKILTAKSEDDKEKYSNFKNQLSLDITQSQATDLESNVEWQGIRVEVGNAITATDSILEQNNRMPQQCNIAVIKQLLVPYKQFDSSFSEYLPKNQSVETSVLNVNSYSKLVKSYSNKSIPQNQDHIPSYAAIERFFTNHGVDTGGKVRINSRGNPIKMRNKNLENNATAISIPEQIHILGRTYGGKNVSLIESDAKNLLAATIKDITTTAYILYKNPQYNVNFVDYINSAMIIYARNKMLCLYDVE